MTSKDPYTDGTAGSPTRPTSSALTATSPSSRSPPVSVPCTVPWASSSAGEVSASSLEAWIPHLLPAAAGGWPALERGAPESIDDLRRAVPGSGPVTASQDRVRRLVQARVATLARSSLRELEEWQTALRSLANHVEDLEGRARRAVDEELGSDDLAAPDSI